MKFFRLFVMVLFAFIVVGCGGAPTPTVAAPITTCPAPFTGAAVTISGTVTFDLVPHLTASPGLNYTAIQQKPARGVTVQAVDATNNAVISCATSTSSGTYSVPVPLNTSVTIRVLAEMRQTTAPTSHFRAVDNTAGNALWAMQGTQASSGTTNQTRDLNAASGWGGTAYTSPRIAAPFAILDAVYDAVLLIRNSAPTTNFPALDLNWSPNNTIALIGTSHYNGTSIFILGAADSDTDEYDRHVIIHEFGHYFEDNFSRSDSIGGSHFTGEQLDMRLAFGEGFGNAFSAMASNDPTYKDAIGPGQGGGFSFNLETNPATATGWFSEASVQSILYDLYDSANDGTDTVSLGFTPIYTVLVNQQRTTPAFTSIFSFITALKAGNSGQATSIDQLVSAQNIVSASMDAYGTTETNNGGLADGALPLYRTLAVGGPAITNLCTSVANGKPNKLGNRRFLRLNIAAAGGRTIVVSGDSTSDPDIYLFVNGVQLQAAENVALGSDSLTRTFTAGDYVIELFDFNYLNPASARTTPSCFTVTIN